jgi:hypothetical protein
MTTGKAVSENRSSEATKDPKGGPFLGAGKNEPSLAIKNLQN